MQTYIFCYFINNKHHRTSMSACTYTHVFLWFNITYQNVKALYAPVHEALCHEDGLLGTQLPLSAGLPLVGQPEDAVEATLRLRFAAKPTDLGGPSLCDECQHSVTYVKHEKSVSLFCTCDVWHTYIDVPFSDQEYNLIIMIILHT